MDGRGLRQRAPAGDAPVGWHHRPQVAAAPWCPQAAGRRGGVRARGRRVLADVRIPRSPARPLTLGRTQPANRQRTDRRPRPVRRAGRLDRGPGATPRSTRCPVASESAPGRVDSACGACSSRGRCVPWEGVSGRCGTVLGMSRLGRRLGGASVWGPASGRTSHPAKERRVNNLLRLDT